jgi:hypothetical protein
MKKILFSISSCCIFQIGLMAQIPQTPLILGSTSLSAGIHLKQNPNTVISQEEITNNAVVVYRAGNQVKLLPGFRVNGLTNQGKFLGIIQPNDYEVVSMNTAGWSVPKYEKLELGLKLPPIIQNQINDFFTSNGTNGINPYDPEALQINFFFALNGTQYKRSAFYYRDFNVTNNAWVENPTEYMHRVRVAPPQTGNGTFYFEVWVNGVLQNPNVYNNFGTFTVTPSNNHGHLTTANTNNTRKFFHEDGTPFFGVGQNLWAPGDNVEPCIDQQYSSCVSPTTYSKLRGWIDDMADNGGNFTRLRIERFQFPVMWANQQYLQNDPPADNDLSKYLVNYDNNQKHMWELDQTFNKLEERDVHAIISLLQDQDFSINSVYDDPINKDIWALNPYSAILGQGQANCKTFFANANAQTIYKKYLDYVIARWGYSTSLGGWMMVNETANLGIDVIGGDATNGYITNSPYNSDLTFRSHVDSWICDMKFYMEQQYPWHPTTTGLTGFDIVNNNNTQTSVYRNIPCLNFWSQNDYTPYVNSQNQTYFLRDWYRFGTAKQYFDDYKPFIWGELGMPDISNDIDKYNDRTFHNANWISIISGALGTGMYWNDMPQAGGINHRANFKAIKAFTNAVDWSQPWIPIVDDFDDRFGTTGANGKQIHTFRAVTNDVKHVIAFSLNKSSHWANDLASSYAGNYNSLLQKQGINPNQPVYDIDPSFSSGNPKVEISPIQGNIFGLTPYMVNKYSTYGNGGLVTSFLQYASFGQLSFNEDMPFAINPLSGVPDYAYIINPYPVFRTSDTLAFNSNDTVYIEPDFITDKQQYTYQYDWGNGITSTDSAALVHYNNPGTYTITLTITNDKADTSSIYTQVVNVISAENQLNDAQISIYPNPTLNNCFLKYDETIFKQANIEIYDQLGKLVLKEILNANNQINIAHLNSGMYFVRFYGKNYNKICKLVKQ